MTDLQLYPFQDDIVRAVRAAFGRRTRKVLVVSPTGSGKTIMFCYIAAGATARGKRVCIVVPRVEILDQVSRALTHMGVAHGLIAAGEPETDALVQVASVATLARRLSGNVPRCDRAFDLLVLDEAHHAVAGSWRSVVDRYPDAFVLGVSATPARLDGRGLGDVFDDMVIGPTVSELIEGRYLVPATVFAPPARLDLTRVRVRAGDYAADDLAAVMSDAALVGDAVRHYRELAAGVPAVAFCASLEHSRLVAERFRAAGVRAAHVDGDTEKDERRRLVAALGTGEVEVLCNANLVSEGFDVPAIGAAILLRPTKSVALYLQQVGRALRPSPGKERAIVLDHAANTWTHGLPEAARTWSLEDRPTRARAGSLAPGARHRTCAGCGAIHEPGTAECAACGAALAPGAVEAAEIEAKLVEIKREEHEELRRRIWRMGYGGALRWAGEDVERLRLVALVRGYRPGWIRHRLEELRAAA